ncbi:hypothetical protein BDY19DRAFT_462537 [Irpex rosettiformis]|uniref:Uncharacterized protein n=1 Tax=Irpex rosettiformis TaxID=378272 RepID=A0ACB8TSM7_9APHY|nr:hypothetical protein BDY19DRAFT_462537 [Irpex rosettiformis]
MSIMQHLFQQPLSLPSPALAPGLQAIADDRRSILEGDGYFYVPPNCRDLVIELFVPRIQEAVEKGQWTTSHYVLLTRTLELSYAGNASTTGNAIRQPVIKVIEKLLKSPSLGSVYVVHEIALGMSKQSNTVKLAAQNAYIDAVMSSSKQERSEILSRFVAFVKLHSQDHHFVDTVGTSTTSVTFDPLSSCLLHLRLIRRIQNVEGEPYSHHKHLWKLIFELLLPRLQLAVLWSRAEHKDVATECLTLIDTIEPMGRGVHQNHPSVLLTRSLPSSRSSLFADDLIRTLSDFLPYPAPASTWRMQRLKLLESRKPAHWQIVKRTGANLGKTISPVPVAQLAREVSQGHDGAERGDSGGAAGDPLAEILAVLGRQPLGQPPADRDATPPQVPNVDVPEETSQSAQPARHHETVAHPPLRGVPEQTRWTDVLSHTPVIATLAATFDGPPPDTEAALDEALPVESQPAAEEPTTAISIAAEMSTTPLLASLLSRIGVSDSGELQGLDLEDEVPVHPRLGRILEILDLTVKPVSTTTNQTNIDGHPDALPSTNTSDESGLAEEQSEMMPSSYVATPTRQKETETKEQLRGPPEDRPAIPVDLSLSRIDEENEQRMEDSFIASSQHNAHTIFVEASLVPSRNSIARDESQDHTQSPKSSTPGDQPPETAFSPTPVEPSDEAHSSMGLPLARYKEEDGPPSYSIMPKPDPWDLSLESIEWPFPLWSDPVQNSMQDDASLLGWLSHLNREANASDPITNDRFTRPEATAYSTTGNGLFEDASYGSTKRISSEEEDLELPNDELLDSIDEPSVVVLQDPDDSEFPVQSGDHAEVISEAGNASGGRDSEELSYVDIEQWRGDANT